MDVISDVEFTARVKKALREIDRETLNDKINKGTVKLEDLAQPIEESHGVVLQRFVNQSVLAKMVGVDTNTIRRRRKKTEDIHYKIGNDIYIMVSSLLK